MELLLIYNAEKDVIGGVFDYAHKLFKPSTYKCDLCVLTHHNFGERKSWKAFKQKTEINLSFHYINSFEKEFDESYDYPVILKRRNEENKVVLSRKELNEILTVEDLIDRIEIILKGATQE